MNNMLKAASKSNSFYKKAIDWNSLNPFKSKPKPTGRFDSSMGGSSTTSTKPYETSSNFTPNHDSFESDSGASGSFHYSPNGGSTNVNNDPVGHDTQNLGYTPDHGNSQEKLVEKIIKEKGDDPVYADWCKKYPEDCIDSYNRGNEAKQEKLVFKEKKNKAENIAKEVGFTVVIKNENDKDGHGRTYDLIRPNGRSVGWNYYPPKTIDELIEALEHEYRTKQYTTSNNKINKKHANWVNKNCKFAKLNKKLAQNIDPKQRTQQRIDSMGHQNHEEWRQPRLTPDGTFTPRIKPTTDANWSKANNGKKEIDIANTQFKDLPEDHKRNVLGSAEVAIHLVEDAISKNIPLDSSFIEKASSIIHDKWIERNKDANPSLLVPYEELSEEEKQKDRVIIISAIKTCKN